MNGLDVAEMEREIASTLIECPECGERVHTLPGEGVPAQSLRCCSQCEHAFFIDLLTLTAAQ